MPRHTQTLKGLNMTPKHRFLQGYLVGLLLAVSCALLLPAEALATTADLPWDSLLERLANSISGPVARALAIIAIVSAGFGYAFSEGGGVLRRSLGIVIGISIAFTAASFFLNDFFGFGGGYAF